MNRAHETKLSVHYRLRQVLGTDDLSALASKIKGDYPHSIHMHNILLMNARGLNSSFGYTFYVLNDYPDAHIVIWVKKFHPYSLAFHCKEDEVPLLCKVLQDEDFIPFLKEDPVEICLLPDYLLEPLHSALQPHQKDPMNKFPNYSFTYVSPQDFPLRCPAGLRVGRLGKKGIRHMLQKSKFNSVDNVDHVSYLAKKTIALGVYVDETAKNETEIDLDNIKTEEDDLLPVAWIGTYHYGTFGMLQTEEAYRRRGLASLLTEMMGRYLAIQGFIPQATVELHNDASAAMFRRMPGWKDLGSSWWLCKDDCIPSN